MEALRLIARGLLNREMARRLVIAESTVAHHVQHIYRKIGVSTRAAATLLAMQHDLLDTTGAAKNSRNRRCSRRARYLLWTRHAVGKRSSAIAILATFTVRGNTEELLKRGDAADRRDLPGQAALPRRRPSEGGIKTFDVWESEEALGVFAQNPRSREALQEVGLPEPEVAPVHRFNW